jgi:2-polyprenyl-3-methyl-5-hydroxy-6-metoxy-1,4-benzoquinol methylase
MDYYHFVRREIQPLLPDVPSRILDVGAGAGATLKWLKTLYPSAETTGVELNSALSDELRQNADIAIIGDIGAAFARLATYDLILLLDVLEHVSDAKGTLELLVGLLRPGGNVIVSVPNISHLSVSVPLLLRRQFTYQDAGILDRTHRTFFVEETAVKLLNDANLVVTKGLVSGLAGPKSNLIDRLSFGFLRHHLARQYIMLGQLTASEFVQPRVRWKIA